MFNNNSQSSITKIGSDPFLSVLISNDQYLIVISKANNQYTIFNSQ